MQWDPLDDSAESWQIGELLFGDQQAKIREEALKQSMKVDTLIINSIDHDSRIIEFKLSKEFGLYDEHGKKKDVTPKDTGLI